MKRVIFLQIVILNIIFFASCVKDKHYLFVEEYDDLNPNKSQDDLAEKTYTFNFNAKITPLNSSSDNTVSKTVYTPDTTAMAQGRIIHIYIYKDDVTPQTGTYSQMLIYEVYTNGFIKPISDQYKINLTAGIYSFYAISENNNSSDKTPGFVNSNGSGGEMQGLSNGLDFLWWSKENVNLGDMTSGDITIYFNHICTQIQLNLQSGPGTVIDAIYAFNMESPNPGSCTLQLGTGVITPSTTLSGSMQNLDSLNNVLFVNLVPFTTTNTDLLVKISISFKDKGSGWIDVNIPVPTDGYEQGHCYIYDVILDFPATTSFETARFDAMLRD